MSFDWADFLVLAKELAQQPSHLPGSEARQRSAISRAYYAVFCRARNHLRTAHPHLAIPADVEAHGFVRQQFANSADPMSRVVAVNLGRLRDYRNQADYDDQIARPEDTAQMALAYADAAMAALDQL
jgi:uncharacterized protein (UPF0332 family)